MTENTGANNITTEDKKYETISASLAELEEAVYS